MHREHVRWYSPRLERDMDLLVFGHAGARAIVFPSSMGRFFEWEDQGMITALAEHLERGWLQLYCVDSVDADSWYAKWKRVSDRAYRHAQYDAYLRDEVLPLTTSRNDNPFLMTTGASFGAYHALSFALRYPHLVSRAIGLSGVYDIREVTNGETNEQVYPWNPAEFVMGEHDGERLAAMQRMDIILAIGRDDPLRGNSEYFSDRLFTKGIWNALRIWDGWSHDWPYWRQMIGTYIGGSDGV
ncbi:MAG: alpha/beta hydrolase-fold protein [Gemmatimonadaceae bacterium]